MTAFMRFLPPGLGRRRRHPAARLSRVALSRRTRRMVRAGSCCALSALGRIVGQGAVLHVEGLRFPLSEAERPIASTVIDAAKPDLGWLAGLWWQPHWPRRVRRPADLERLLPQS